MTKRVACIGSRSWTDEATVAARMAVHPKDTLFVVSGSGGAESCVVAQALKAGRSFEIQRGSWEKDRHTSLLASCHALEAFPVPGSAVGTAETIATAIDLGIPVTVSLPEER